MKQSRSVVLLLILLFATNTDVSNAQSSDDVPLQIKGVFPEMTIRTDRNATRSESAVGALLPWADKLWAIGYVSHISGAGIGLYTVDDQFNWEKHPKSVTGTFANRYVHDPSNQAIIGPHIIDTDGNVRTIEALKNFRLTATISHLTDPDNMVYFVGMEGPMWETNVHTLETRKLFDLVDELKLEPGKGKAHFKGAHTARGRVFVANNSYYENDQIDGAGNGRLAEWDGTTWKILEHTAFMEVAGKGPRAKTYGEPVYAVGWDRASVIFKVLTKHGWKNYRLPKGSHSFDHAWNTEWFRIREAQSERYLMDAHGLFYELPTLVYEGHVWGVKPIAYHLRMVPDFCYWKGLFVMGGSQTDVAVGQPQSGLWFGNIDELWQMGKPTGWGGPWWETDIQADVPSDPFLMTGFDQKVVHLTHDSNQAVEFTIEVDFLGNGTWHTYDNITVPPHGYRHHEFPTGFSAHWVRVTVNTGCTATVYFVYT